MLDSKVNGKTLAPWGEAGEDLAMRSHWCLWLAAWHAPASLVPWSIQVATTKYHSLARL